MNDFTYGMIVTGIPVLLFWINVLNEGSFNQGERILATAVFAGIVLVIALSVNDPVLMSC
jgi:hypothetical protein